MSHFVFPQRWITPAIAAAAMAFGPTLEDTDTIRVKYRNLPGQSAGSQEFPDKIIIDKRPKSEWPREKAQCVIIHEYGHLAGKGHKKNPNSIMYPVLRYQPCHRWLVRHGIE